MDGLELQIRAVLASIVAGMLMGVLYDLCTFIRRVFRMRRAATALGDLSYWLFSSAMTFSIMMRTNRGEVRLYVLAGIAIGFWVHTFTGRVLITPLLTIIEWAMRRMIRSSRRSWSAVRRPMLRSKRQISKMLMQGLSSARRTLSRAGKSECAPDDALEGYRQPAREVNE